MKTVTKTELARATELSLMICGTILNEWLKTGEVIELKFDSSSEGHLAIVYQADIHEDYMDGLKALAFEKISDELKVVKKHLIRGDWDDRKRKDVSWRAIYGFR